MATLVPPSSLGSSASSYYSSPSSSRSLSAASEERKRKEEETRRAREDLLRLRTAEAAKQAVIPGQLQAARQSPENLAIANIERQRAATDYQYALAGLPTPTESEAQQGTGIGVRQALVTPEERLRRQAGIDEAQGALRLAQASERVGRAEISEERTRAAEHEAAIAADRAEREEERKRVSTLRIASRPVTKQSRSREEAALANAPFGWVYDPETGFAVAPDVFRKRQAERGITLDEVNREYVSRKEMLNRVSPEGHVWRKSDNAWVDTKTGHEFVNGRWENKDDGTYMNPSDRIWRDKRGNFYDRELKAWRNPTTGWVQQGIYWVDPRTRQKFWQGYPVDEEQEILNIPEAEGPTPPTNQTQSPTRTQNTGGFFGGRFPVR